MTGIVQIFRQHPELAVFLTLALGFLIGRFQIGSFRLGNMLGTLLAGMLVGQMVISVSPVAKILFFDLFLFATGYKVGPQFFYGLKKDALPQIIITLVICVSCLVLALFASKILGYDVGTAAGMLAGAFTESTVIGTAGDAIQRLNLDDAEKQRLLNNIPVAYAVTYLVGTTTVVWFLSSMAPKLMRVNLAEEAQKMPEFSEKNKETIAGINSAYASWLLRAFRITNKNWTGKAVSEIEKSIPDARIFIERVRKNGIITEPEPGVIIEEGDIVVIAARQSVMLEKINDIGPEVQDKELLDFKLETMDIVISHKDIAGRSLQDLASLYGQGIMLKKLIRGHQEMPFRPDMVIQRGDILEIFGRDTDVNRTASQIGFKEKNISDTDIFAVAIGIVLGGMVGYLSLKIAGVVVTLGTSGGALVLGLVFGWWHSKSPGFGRIPEAALWIFDTLGLATFLGIVGITAGPTFISGLKHTGISLVFAGILVAVLPHVFGLLVGRFILKMNPLVLLGAQSGAGTTTIALKALQDVSGSKIPVLGYTIPYALGNILLTAWGPLMVSLMT
jgi:putative transport protein